MRYVDPDGNFVNAVAAGVGAVIGAGVGTVRAWASGASAREIAAAAVGGAVTGGLAGLTCGASLGVTVVGSAMAGAAGYCATNLVAGEAGTVEGMANAAAGGAVGAMAGAVVGKAVAGITAASKSLSSNISAKTKSASGENRVFWSGLGKNGASIAENWAKENNCVTLEMYLKDAGVQVPAFSDNPEFWSNASENFAKSAKGNVRALIGPNIRSNSIWNTIEKQTLLNNPNVNSITEINLGD